MVNKLITGIINCAILTNLKSSLTSSYPNPSRYDTLFSDFFGNSGGTRGIFLIFLVIVIVSFDLTIQQFKNVPYPPTNYPPNKYAWRILDKFGEYLCIKDYHHDVVDLWVMNFPGAERTWYKALSKEAHGYGEGYSGVHSDRMTEDPSVHMHSYRFLAFSRSGEVLVERQSHLHTLRLLFWDKLDHCNRMSTIRQIRIPEFHVRLISFVYTESLLHLTEDEDDPLQQKPSIHKQKKNHEKNIRDDLMSAGFSLRL